MFVDENSVWPRPEPERMPGRSSGPTPSSRRAARRFLILALISFGDRIGPALARDVASDGWVIGGVTYASYNVVAVVAVLPFVRNMISSRDGVVAGMLAGPLAMLPALLFFLCMTAFYPAISVAALPSDYMLERMRAPWLQIVFQIMIFCALLETGAGVINAVNERIAEAIRERRAGQLPRFARLGVSSALLIGSAFIAARIGLIDLIAAGYGAFGYIMLAVFVLPLLTIGVARLRTGDGRVCPAEPRALSD